MLYILASDYITYVCLMFSKLHVSPQITENKLVKLMIDLN